MLYAKEALGKAVNKKQWKEKEMCVCVCVCLCVCVSPRKWEGE